MTYTEALRLLSTFRERVYEEAGRLAAAREESIKKELDKQLAVRVEQELERRLELFETNAIVAAKDETQAWVAQVKTAVDKFRDLEGALEPILGPRVADESMVVHDIRRALADLEDVLTVDAPDWIDDPDDEPMGEDEYEPGVSTVESFCTAGVPHDD